MKNHKQLLADFYLNFLSTPYLRQNYPELHKEILIALSAEVGESCDTIANIFERMAAEDASSN